MTRARSSRRVVILDKSWHSRRLPFVLPPTEFEYVKVSDIRFRFLQRLRYHLNRQSTGHFDPQQSHRFIAQSLILQYGLDTAFVCFDNLIGLVEALAETGHRGPIVMIQHGCDYQTYLSDPHRLLANTALLTWGFREHESYGFKGLRPRLMFRAGSLSNALFQGHRQASAPHNEDVQFNELVVISEYKPDSMLSSKPAGVARSRGWIELLGLLRSFSQQTGVKLTIALKPSYTGGGGEQSQRQYFSEFLGDNCQFTNPAIPFSTEYACENSMCVLGVQASPTLESLIRGNKTVFSYPDSDRAAMQIPLTGLAILPSREEPTFIEDLWNRIQIPNTDFFSSLRPNPAYFGSPTRETLSIIRRCGQLLRQRMDVDELVARLVTDFGP